MSFPCGTRLGAYEITGSLGAGGMGEVYTARDTRLGRTVAVKVLPVDAASDPKRRQRFEQEARAISALNHPHICVLHDVGREVPAAGGMGDQAEGPSTRSARSGQAGGPSTRSARSGQAAHPVDFLVMEHLEGQTLAHRLRRGPLPLDQALEIGAQICEALAHAHAQGIVHRDLKPSNLMLMKDGAVRPGSPQVKLLDFGLAKLKAQPARAATGRSALSTEGPSTTPGAVLGTVPYMAPEQLEGKEADARTDLFALGCVLYEMVTGRRAFQGESEASVIAAIMSSDPAPPSSLQAAVPRAIDRLVQRCLVKVPEERSQSAHDLAGELRSLKDSIPWLGRAPARRRWFGWRGRLWPLAGAVAVVAAGASGWFWLREAVRPAPRHVTLALPPDLKFQSLSTSTLATAPDGSGAVLSLRHPDAVSFRLYWLGLADPVPRELPGTEGADTPFFSPDGKWLAFARQGKLLKVPFEDGGLVAGGTPSVVSTLPARSLRGGTWGEDGTILFAPTLGGLWRVPAEGGEARQVTWPDAARHESSHRWPRFLPGGRAALFTINHASLRMDRAVVGLVSLGDGRWRRIVEGGGDARYLSSGHLVYDRNGTLLAAPFDLATLRPTPPFVPVLAGVATWTDAALAAFDVSAAGTLLYAAGTRSVPQHSLVWLDRKGLVEAVAPEPRAYRPNFDLSRDGRRAAVAVRGDDDLAQQLWIYHLSTGQWQRLPSDPDADAAGPIWSPDGRRIVFSSNADGPFSLYLVDAEGEKPPERLTECTQAGQFPYSWSPDGRFIAYQEQNGKTGWNTFILPLEGDRKPWLWDKEGVNATVPAFSPDGRWLAYQSFESGGPEVYVRPFPGPGRKTRISGKEGGYGPVWSPDGREIVYLPKGLVDNRILGARVQPGEAMRVTDRSIAFAPPFPIVPNIAPHYRVIALSPDGQRLLTIRPDPASVDPVTFGELHAITNFPEEVRAKLRASGRSR